MPGQLKTSNPEMGEFARKRREALGLSRNELAAILGVGRTRMQQMETEGVEGITTITRWANALDIDPADLAFPVHQRAVALSKAPKGAVLVRRETLAETVARYPETKKTKKGKKS